MGITAIQEFVDTIREGNKGLLDLMIEQIPEETLGVAWSEADSDKLIETLVKIGFIEKQIEDIRSDMAHFDALDLVNWTEHYSDWKEMFVSTYKTLNEDGESNCELPDYFAFSVFKFRQALYLQILREVLDNSLKERFEHQEDKSQSHTADEEEDEDVEEFFDSFFSSSSDSTSSETADDRTLKIKALNDKFRESGGKGGEITISKSVNRLISENPELRDALIPALKDAKFDPETDPSGTHRFGSFYLGSEKCFFQIQYRSIDGKGASPDESDEKQTQRKMVILLASEHKS